MTRNRIVAGIDGTGAGEQVLRWAVGEARRRGTTLVVATAWAGHSDRTGPASPTRTAALAELLSSQRSQIEAACAGLPVAARPVICQEVEPGDPVTMLTRLARDADLVVVGTDRDGGLGVASVAGRLAGRLRHPGALGSRCVLVAVPVTPAAVPAAPPVPPRIAAA